MSNDQSPNNADKNVKKALETLTSYGNKVIDLSRRNRLLNFPKNGKKITFNMSLNEFLRIFGSLDSLEIEFVHNQILNNEKLQNIKLDKISAKNSETKKEQIYIPETDLQGESLLNMLNALRLETKRRFEEHGLHTLFLSIGKVKWKEPSVGLKKSGNVVVEDYDFNAPLLLVPIHIEEKKNPKKTVVFTYLETGDITVNKVLGLLLEKEYKSGQPELTHENEDNWTQVYKNLCSQVKEIFTELKLEYEIIDDIQIGQYSFFGQQIYADLCNNKESIIQNEFINALCTHSQIQQENLIVKVENPDLLLTPEGDYNVMDADRSQLQVLQNVINGNHLNIQGPPGTGKSQTIVNLISNLLARGKTVLMVCEKQIALEVVLARLKATGLDKLCLPLFDYNADKKIFAKSIIEDRDRVIRMEEQAHGIGNLDTPLANREKKIIELRAYATALGEIVQPLNKSLHWVHGEWAKHADITSDASIPWMGSDPLHMSYDEYHKLMYVLDNIAPVLNLGFGEKVNHWKNIRKKHFSPDFVNRVNKILEDTRELILSATLINSDIVKFGSINDIRRLVVSQELVDSIQPIRESFIIESNLCQTATMLVDALDLIKQYQNIDHAYLEKYNIPVLWDSELIRKLDDIIDDSTKISVVKLAALDSPVFKDHIDTIRMTSSVLSIGDLTINELLLYKNLLLVDSVIANIKDWGNIDILQNISEPLSTLNTINNQLNKVKKTLDSWGVIIDEIEPSSALSVSDRFNDIYGSSLRYFYFSKYRKDCKILNAWCNASVPQSHMEYAEIAAAIKDFFRLQNKYKILLESFNENYILPGKAIRPQQVSILFSNVKNIVELFYEQGQNCLFEKIMRMSSFGNQQSIKNLYAAIQDIHKILNTSWDIFKSGRTNCDIPLNAFIHSYTSLQKNIENTLKLYEAIYDIYKEKGNDCTISQLKKDAREIDDLFLQLEKIQQLQIGKLYENNNIVEAIIKDSKKIEDLSVNLKNLTLVFDTNIKLHENPTIKQAVEFTIELRRILPSLNQWIERYTRLEIELNRLFENETSINFIEGLSFVDAMNVINKMLDDNSGLEKWIAYMRHVRQLEESGQSWFLEATKNKIITNPSSLFAQSLWSAWLESYYVQKSAVQNFNIKDHQRIISEFKNLEKQVLQINALRIMAKYAPEFDYAKRFGGEKDKLLVRQSQLKMRHQPIRKVVCEIGLRLLEYKPCWMMSPLTLSSYIPYGSLNFDVVIFDEASQLRVEHSLPAISRAKQVVIFGDENQLPPTSFFENSSETEGEDEEVIENYESILHATKEILPGANGLLSHHYRSKHEDLIAFSNHYVYSDQLITFPSPNKLHKAVQFSFIEDGVFDGGKGGSRRNDIEAKRVIEMCIKQATEEPNKSLGVIAFSRAQEVAIRDALLDSLKDKPHLQSLLDETSDSPEQFFIKNLESVQGDERDVIILSVGYGKDKRTGEVYNRFGPINSQYGYRRLNVAITRAKEKIICVSSIKSSDIRNAEKSRGAFMLQKYLEYAERGVESLDASLLLQSQLGISADSPFEEEVEKALVLRGYIVHRQVGVSGFKIDLAIVNPKNDQQYILGIECDGATYHSSYSARMNDRMRQQILERMGWKIYRIWSQHWISHKEDIIEDIIRITIDGK